MTKRKAIGPKLRFEVFKRDSFKCQYCGNVSPDVILQVDHIKPVAKGGTNDILNLITSCFECNAGKSDRLISDSSIVSIQRKQMEELNEKRNQIEMMIEWKKGLSDKSYEINSIVKYFNDTNNTSFIVNADGIPYFRNLLKKYSLAQIIDGINQANDRYANLSPMERFGKIESCLSWLNSSESDKLKMKIFGAIKRKFCNDRAYYQRNITQTNSALQKIFKMIDSGQTFYDYSDLLDIVNDTDNYYHLYNPLLEILNNP